jgi:hypothetical protein
MPNYNGGGSRFLGAASAAGVPLSRSRLTSPGAPGGGRRARGWLGLGVPGPPSLWSTSLGAHPRLLSHEIRASSGWGTRRTSCFLAAGRATGRVQSARRNARSTKHISSSSSPVPPLRLSAWPIRARPAGGKWETARPCPCYSYSLPVPPVQLMPGLSEASSGPPEWRLHAFPCHKVISPCAGGTEGGRSVLAICTSSFRIHY